MTLISAVAACGGGSSKQQSAVASPAQRQAAGRINLVATDFPAAWTDSPSTPAQQASNPVRNAVNDCVRHRTGVAIPLLSEPSDNFLDGPTGAEVGSQVQVFSTPPPAIATASSLATSDSDSCIRSEVDAALNASIKPPASVHAVTVQTGAWKDPGQHPFAVRVQVQVVYPAASGAADTAQVYLDVLGFSAGPRVVEALFENPGSPPDQGFERTIMSKLSARAVAP
jgi:hypothetical protein